MTSQKTKKKEEKKWVVLWTLSGREKRVKKILETIVEELDLRDRVGRILVPTETVVSIRKGQRIIYEKPLFRGYVLVEMEPDVELLDLFRSYGNLRALVAGEDIMTLSNSEVNKIMETLKREKEKRKAEVPFMENETVRIIDGPFAEFTGVVEEVYPDRGKLKVLVNIFGRTTPVVLDFLQVKRVY